MSDRPSLRRLSLEAILRPRLWPLMMAAAWRFRRRDWYRRPPFVPVPSAAYLDWRMHTAYGREGEPSLSELEGYLRWSARMSRGDGAR